MSALSRKSGHGQRAIQNVRDKLKERLTDIERSKILREAEQELQDYRKTRQAKKDQTTPLSTLIDDLIERGLELRRDFLGFAKVASDNPDVFIFPSGREGRQFVTQFNVWVDQVAACIIKWHPTDETTAKSCCFRLKQLVVPGQSVQCPGTEILDQLLNMLHSIVPRLHIQTFNAEKHLVRQQLVGDELDHAQQLLELKGTHQEAILRAAGIIAGVALERHLKDIVNAVNAVLPANKKKYPEHRKRHSIVSYADFLIGEDVIHPSKRTSFQDLNHIRTCCSHPPRGDLTVPTKDQVQTLINETRRHVSEIAFL